MISLLFVLQLAIGNSYGEEPNSAPPTPTANSLSDEHADWVHRHLAPAATFRGQERRDFLAALLTEDLNPELTAAVERAQKVAANDEASFGAVIRSAVRPQGIPIPARKKLHEQGPAKPSAKAMRAYRARHLRVKAETHHERGDTVVVTNSGPAYGPWPYWGWSTTQVFQQPDSVQHGWAVYQDFVRLSVPDFLEIAGRGTDASQMRVEIGSLETKAHNRRMVGLAGVAISLGGMVALSIDPQNTTASLASFGGALTLTAGFLSSGFPSMRSHSLRDSYAATLSPQETRSLVDEHNENLREELRLATHDAIMLETGHRERNN